LSETGKDADLTVVGAICGKFGAVDLKGFHRRSVPMKRAHVCLHNAMQHAAATSRIVIVNKCS